MSSPDHFPNPPVAPRDQERLRPKIVESLKQTLGELEAIALAGQATTPIQGPTQERLGSILDWFQDLTEGREGVPEDIEESNVVALYDRLTAALNDFHRVAEGHSLPVERTDLYTNPPYAAKVTAALEHLSKHPNTDPNAILFCLERLDIGTHASIQLRKQIYKNNREDPEFTPERLIASLYNVLTEEAAQLLEEILNDGIASEFHLKDALLNNGSPTAMRLRKRMVRSGHISYALQSLMWLDTPEANTFRYKHLPDASREAILLMQSITGIDTPDALRFRRQLLAQPSTNLIHVAAQSLHGVGSDDSIELRRELLTLGAVVSDILYSLKGIATLESIRLRHDLLSNKNLFPIADSLEDIETPEAEALRDAFIELPHTGYRDYQAAARSLYGIRSSASFKQRHKLFQLAKDKLPADEHVGWVTPELARGLKGVDVPESIEFFRFLAADSKLPNDGYNRTLIEAITQALDGLTAPDGVSFREELFKQIHDNRLKGRILESLARVDTKEAHALRRRYINAFPNSIAESLVGTSSPESMELRTLLLVELRGDLESLAPSLREVYTDEALQFRDTHFHNNPGAYMQTFVDTDPLYDTGP